MIKYVVLFIVQNKGDCVININFVEHYFIKYYGREELEVNHDFSKDINAFLTMTNIMVKPLLNNINFEHFMLDHLLLEKRTYEDKQLIYSDKISDTSEELMFLQQLYPYHDDMVDLTYDIEQSRHLESFYYDMELACDYFLQHIYNNIVLN